MPSVRSSGTGDVGVEGELDLNAVFEHDRPRGDRPMHLVDRPTPGRSRKSRRSASTFELLDNARTGGREPLVLLGEAGNAAAALQQCPHRVQSGTGVKRRPEQLHHHRAGTLDELDGRRGKPTLPDPGFSAKHHPGCGQCRGPRAGPALLQPRPLAVAAHQSAESHPGRFHPFTEHPVVGNEPPDTLDRSRRAGLQLKVVMHQRL